jgi:hypothetical protein
MSGESKEYVVEVGLVDRQPVGFDAGRAEPAE